MEENDNSYVTRDVAELLQKLGYECENELSRKGYYLDSDILSCEDSGSIHYDTFILAPLLFEVEKWLREKYSLHIQVSVADKYTFDAELYDFIKAEDEDNDEPLCIGSVRGRTYEEAVNRCIDRTVRIFLSYGIGRIVIER